MQIRQKILALLGCLACLWGLAGMAQANGTWTWVGGSSGNWDVATNWDPTSIPGNDWNFPYDTEIIPDGVTVNVTTYGASGVKDSAGLQVGSGSLLDFLSNGGGLRFRSANTDVANNGTIRLDDPSNPQGLDNYGNVVTFSGTGRVTLAGNGLHGLGGAGTFVNGSSHTIQGGGGIDSSLTNQGTVLANNGTLRTNSQIDNTGGTLAASGSGNILFIYGSGGVAGGQLLPQDGQVNLSGTYLSNMLIGPGLVQVIPADPSGRATFKDNVTLSAGTAVLVQGGMALRLWNGDGGSMGLMNQGTITLANANSTWLDVSNNTVTLGGSGQVVLGGNGNSGIGGSATCINDVQHTIQGGGQINVALNNKGTLIANNGQLAINSSVTGSGPVFVQDNATLRNAGQIQCGNFTMSQLANWYVMWNHHNMDLKGNFSFAQQDSTRWTFEDGTMNFQMSGGGGGGGGAGKQSLEVGGHDFGAVNSGYTNNFSIPRLTVTGSNTYVYLLDAIDNGHREGVGKREALYVETLQVDPGATLDLHGLRLYAKRSGIIYRVTAGQGSLYGGGKIIDSLAGTIPGIIVPLNQN